MESTSTDGATVGEQMQNAVSTVLRWASRAAVRMELYGQGNQGLALTDVWLLEAIVREGPIRATDLAAWQGVDKSTVTPQLRRIEQRGLIARRADPADNRASLLTATPAGRRLHRKIVGTGSRLFDELLGHWSEQDRRTLGLLLSRFSAELLDRPGVR